MKYSTLGGTGLLVSNLAFGTMTFGSASGAAGAVFKVDAPLADRLVGQALDAGVNYFNTADMYAGGESERLLGQALGKRRGEIAIATKVGHRTGPGLIQHGLSRRHILEAAEASLRRLNTEWIDVYLVHLVDPNTPLEETLEALQQLVRAGKVRYVGFSNWPAWMAAKSVAIQHARGWEPFRAAEMYYSLLTRDLEHEVVPFAVDAGVGVQVWSPLAGGFLSGKYTRQTPDGGGGRLASFDLIPFERERGYGIVDELRAVAELHGARPAQIALAWLLTRPAVSTVLVGASSEAQLAENLRAAEISLTPADLARLEAASALAPLYPTWFNAKVFDADARKALGR
jgi:aryl-alcohol dehydrogenase-like predicted oxidoreductase